MPNIKLYEKKGRPQKYADKTTPITFAIPISKVDDIKSVVRAMLKSYEVKGYNVTVK